jgi:serine/threonine protein kinase/tetratricopeptide (TPR) repeat protein
MPALQLGPPAPSLSNGRQDQSSSQEPHLPPSNGLALAATDEPLTTDNPKATQQVFVDGKLNVENLPQGIPPPPRIDGYEILGVLGRGGMGVVYKGRDIRLQRIVALKMILSGAHASSQELQRFQTEARAVAKLQHPNIVQIYDINQQDGHGYFSLEYVDGDNLAQHIHSSPQPPRWAARIVETLARAMFYAHEHNVVHRDLKPSNILLQRKSEAASSKSGIRRLQSEKEGSEAGREFGSSLWDFEPKITDFGVAKQLDSEQGNTRTGAIVGTPSYMAPEQARGESQRTGPAVDIYSLGVILYEMLTGRPPFGDGAPMDILFRVAHDDPVPPSRREPVVPRDLEIICLKCLEKDPNRRYLTAQALANDLARFLADEPILARPMNSWELGWRWVKRHKAMTAVAAAVGLAVAGISGGISLSANADHRHLVEKVAEARSTVNDDKAWENTPAILADIDTQVKDQLISETIWPTKQEELESIKNRYAARALHRDLTQAYELIMPRAILALREASQNVGVGDIQKEAWQALARAGFSLREKGNLIGTFDLTPVEREEIERICYELILLVAETKGGDEALTILDLAEPLIIKSPTYFARRAECLMQTGQQQAAEAERQRANQCQLTALDHFLKGENLYKQGKEKPAIEEFVRALQMKPDHFWARYFMSVCYINANQAALARDNLTVCVKEKPDFVWTYLMRGYAEGRLGEYPAAEADFNSVLKRTSDRETLYALYNNRGVMRLNQRDRFAEGVQDLQEAARLCPKKYNAYVSLADAYARQKNWNEALGNIELAIANADDPATKGPLYRYRARYHAELKDDTAALADLNQEIELESAAGLSSAKAYVLRGQLQKKNGQPEEALQSFDAAQRSQPGFIEAIRGRADILAEKKKYPEAIQALNELINKSMLPTAQDYKARGLAKAMSNDPQGAAEDYSRALELENKAMASFNPEPSATGLDTDKKTANVVWLLTRRGHAYLACQADRAGLHDFDEALRLDSKNREALGGRGLVRVRLGQIDAGLEDARKSLVLGAPTARICYNAGRVYAQAAAAIDSREPRSHITRDKKFEYQNRALELVSRALELLPESQRGAFWQETIRKDAYLSSIHRTQAFSRLEEKYAPKISAGLMTTAK